MTTLTIPKDDTPARLHADIAAMVTRHASDTSPLARAILPILTGLTANRGAAS